MLFKPKTTSLETHRGGSRKEERTGGGCEETVKGRGRKRERWGRQEERGGKKKEKKDRKRGREK